MKIDKLKIVYLVNILTIIIIEFIFISKTLMILDSASDNIKNSLILIIIGNQINYSLLGIGISFFSNLLTLKSWVKINKWIIHSLIIIFTQFTIFIISLIINNNIYSI